MGGMYLVDYDYEKKKAEAARKEEAEKGGEM